VNRWKTLLPINSGNLREILHFFRKMRNFEDCFYHSFRIRPGESERLRDRLT